MSISPVRTLHDIFDGFAPESRAITVWDNGKLVFEATRGDMIGYVQACADELRKAGVREGDTVSLAMGNSVEYIITFLAATWIRAVAAPLNPGYKTTEFEFYMEDVQSKILVVSSKENGGNLEAEAAAKKLDIPVYRTLSLTSKKKGVPAGRFELFNDDGNKRELILSTLFTRTLPLPTDVALYLHTSGTTSRPKLVPLTHHNLCTSMGNIRNTYELGDCDTCYLVMPLFHIHGLMGALFSTLCSGGTVAIPLAGKFSANVFWNDVRASQATWYTAVPTIHQILLARSDKTLDSMDDIKLRFIRSCSASLAPIVMTKMEKMFGAPVLEAYAMTESAHQMTANPLPANGPHKPGSVGKPTNVQLRILDENDQQVSNGKTGQVCLRGENITTGYRNRPEANREAFSSGWFHTGDIGYLDEHGYLFLTGRLKELINRGGEKNFTSGN
mmetsp:Transcript_22289/g.27258  ORF Transcript_22289/g.27258 Transcript_22289/m.27258 type:complete len:444 (-) Transcript_22289:435-1766(-)